MLTAGSDVWLNNPLRPYEASGTSGMKPPMHGGMTRAIAAASPIAAPTCSSVLPDQITATVVRVATSIVTALIATGALISTASDKPAQVVQGTMTVPGTIAMASRLRARRKPGAMRAIALRIAVQ